jgi:hypothetical protein
MLAGNKTDLEEKRYIGRAGRVCKCMLGKIRRAVGVESYCWRLVGGEGEIMCAQARPIARRQVSKEEGDAKAKELNVMFIETSAKGVRGFFFGYGLGDCCVDSQSLDGL